MTTTIARKGITTTKPTLEVILAAEAPGTLSYADLTPELLSAVRAACRKVVKGECVHHKAVARWYVKKVCAYCGRTYQYNLLVGDINHGACSRSACVLASMRDHL